ncbi:MAG: ABC transporter substrate-binding protein [Actinomycetaceae bacterium]|nr:ABC transporter substrate-binding protein [Actinomycetaceae bacterium]
MLRKTTRGIAALAGVALASTLALTGCASTDDKAASGEGGSDVVTTDPINIGTTDKVLSLDPAAAYDNGSFAVAINVYPMLMGVPAGGNKIEPDIAESAEFSDPSTYEVKLKKGLKFANGHDLTAEDVKFSFDRMNKINHPEGPQSLLANLEETKVVDDTTVQFKLKAENDQTFPQILTTPAALILDSEVFSADEITPADKIVSEKAFAGPYIITNYQENSSVSYERNPDYQGLYPAKNELINVEYLANETNLKQKVEKSEIDVAYRSLSPTAIEDLKKNAADKLNVVEGPGGEVRYMVFNSDSMPFGAKTPDADPAKALAVRQAIADTIDRQAISDNVFKGTYTPVYSMVPEAMPGSDQSYKSEYGDGKGGPSVEKAKSRLDEAGVSTPVTLTIQYSPDHYGKSSADEYAAIKQQLEESNLFKVELQSTAWTTYSEERIASYPIYQLGWFPDFSDADNYLSPFFLDENFVQSYNSALDESFQKHIKAATVETDADKREEELQNAQKELAKHVLTLPMLSGVQIAVAQKNVEGVVLDASFKFHYSSLTK